MEVVESEGEWWGVEWSGVESGGKGWRVGGGGGWVGEVVGRGGDGWWGVGGWVESGGKGWRVGGGWSGVESGGKGWRVGGGGGWVGGEGGEGVGVGGGEWVGGGVESSGLVSLLRTCSSLPLPRLRGAWRARSSSKRGVEGREWVREGEVREVELLTCRPGPCCAASPPVRGGGSGESGGGDGEGWREW